MDSVLVHFDYIIVLTNGKRGQKVEVGMSSDFWFDPCLGFEFILHSCNSLGDEIVCCFVFLRQQQASLDL